MSLNRYVLKINFWVGLIKSFLIKIDFMFTNLVLHFEFSSAELHSESVRRVRSTTLAPLRFSWLKNFWAWLLTCGYDRLLIKDVAFRQFFPYKWRPIFNITIRKWTYMSKTFCVLLGSIYPSSPICAFSSWTQATSSQSTCHTADPR